MRVVEQAVDGLVAPEVDDRDLTAGRDDAGPRARPRDAGRRAGAGADRRVDGHPRPPSQSSVFSCARCVSGVGRVVVDGLVGHPGGDAQRRAGVVRAVVEDVRDVRDRGVHAEVATQRDRGTHRSPGPASRTSAPSGADACALEAREARTDVAPFEPGLQRRRRPAGRARSGTVPAPSRRRTWRRGAAGSVPRTGCRGCPRCPRRSS